MMLAGRALMETWLRRVWFEEDTAAIDEMFIDGGDAHGLGKRPHIGPEGFKQFHAALCALLQEIDVSIDKCIEEGVWFSAICTLKARSQEGGIPVTTTGSIMARIENGKIQEAYNHFDFMNLWAQLGYLPEDSFEQGLMGNKVI